VADELVGGRYRLDKRLGFGGMSEVWAAEDTDLGRRVAIKLLGRDADAARFDREARAVAALDHPNICRLYDYGDADGRRFMVLEYLGGGTLEDRLAAAQPHPDAETARIAREIASALAHAHARGLVHRDLKPANVLFDDDGHAKIADFGIARLSGAGTLTEAGTLLGTAAYISPEQATGQPATPASDVYSFGVIVYRMLTGRLPFESESALELATMHVNEQPRPVHELRPDAPAELAAIADAALTKDPEARPRDGAALAAMLGGDAETISSAPTVIAAGEPTAVMSRPRRRAWWRRERRVEALPLVLAAILVLVAAGAGLAILATRNSHGSGPSTKPTRQAKRNHTTGTAAVAPTTHATSSTRSTPRTTTPKTTSTPPPPPPPPPPLTLPTTVTLPTTLATTGTLPTTVSPPPPPPASPAK
jgi:eukaryotic-like serine/threonine-protein kinase